MFKSSRTLSILGLVLTLLLVFSGVAVSQVKNPNTITVAHIGQITSIDPAYPNFSSNANTFFWATYEGLVRFSKDDLNEFTPLLATKVPTRENGLITEGKDGNISITFPLRDGVKFHKGGEMTPEDVKYSFLRKLTLEPTGGEASDVLFALTGYNSLNAWARDLEDVEGFSEASQETVNKMYGVLDEAIEIDGMEVTFHLKERVGLFLTFIAKETNGTGLVYDKEWAIEQGAWPGSPETWQNYYDPKQEETALYDIENGTGGFQISRWNISDQEMILDRFDEYWQGPAEIENVKLDYVEEWSTRQLMLQKGDADFAYVPTQYMSQVEEMDGVVVEPPKPSGVIRVLFYQWPIQGTRFTGSGKLDGNGIPPDFFADVDVRQAFNYLMPYERFNEQILNGDAFRIPGPLSSQFPAASSDVPMYEYNKEKAIEHLKKAHDGKVWEKGFKFTAVYNAGNTLAKTGLEMLAAELRQIKPEFRFDLHASTWNEFIPLRTQNKIPFFYSGWGAS
ncbi:ABC transporter substrate-binding protein, partial [Candidatus Bipolaricaulota bacterium]|nr:ABC transporter substrate-binding protein [Candidatus Bipolaricaulota bacterium]